MTEKNYDAFMCEITIVRRTPAIESMVDDLLSRSIVTETRYSGKTYQRTYYRFDGVPFIVTDKGLFLTSWFGLNDPRAFTMDTDQSYADQLIDIVYQLFDDHCISYSEKRTMPAHITGKRYCGEIIRIKESETLTVYDDESKEILIVTKG